MGISLVLVPSTMWVPEADMFANTGVLVLDNLLIAGSAGIYFKRLAVSAGMHPEDRAEYDQKRHDYLSAVLPLVLTPRVKQKIEDEKKNLVVVGTHPRDVDLLDYSNVAAVQIADFGLRDLSKIVCGDPLMLGLSYTSIVRAVADAVDNWYNVNSWREVTMLVMRGYTNRAIVDTSLPGPTLMRILSGMLEGEPGAQVSMEEEIRLDFNLRKGFLIADYDYLMVIRNAWRDPVVRLLGPAPSVRNVFRLPWHVVDPSMVNQLCFRTVVSGAPAASMTGAPLVDFVRTRLASEFTTRELVGTWVGALLCDNVVANATGVALQKSTIAPVDERSESVGTPGSLSDVPAEYMWMYEAVSDVKRCDWTGPRDVEGNPVVRDTGGTWVYSLPLAELFGGYKDNPGLRSQVVALFYRIHHFGFDKRMVHLLLAHGRMIKEEGPTGLVFDPGFTMFLPGYTYLACFAPSVRFTAVGMLGHDPPPFDLMRRALSMATPDGTVSVEEVAGEISRVTLLAGTAGAEDASRVSIGDGGARDGEKPGYCYAVMFAAPHRARIKQLLGAYPTLGEVLDWNFTHWWDEDAMSVVKVTYGAMTSDSGGREMVMHFSREGDGVLLDQIVKSVRWHHGSAQVADTRVGDPGVCYGMQVFVAMVIAWTIVGVMIFMFLCYLTYMRCGGRGRSGGGGMAMYGRR